MNILLIFFAFPLATIIISIILQTLLKKPIAVASLIFSIFLIVTFSAFDETFLIATLAYTILSFVTAVITKLLLQIDDNDEDEDEDERIRKVLLKLLKDSTNSNNETASNELTTLISDTEDDREENTNTASCGCAYNRRRYGKF